MLALLPDLTARRREIFRLHEWLLEHELTCLITLKAAAEEPNSVTQQPYGFMQFMVDCSVILNHTVVLGVSQRNLRVQKYRGSSFDENESPFVIGKAGFDVAIVRVLGRVDADITNERVTSGVKRLDTMLGGGYYRAACVLITGFPGTAKTTLSGAFAEAACRRGERTMFVSFDSDGTEVIRNLASVGIRLDRYLKNGMLRMVSARSITGSAEMCLVRIKEFAHAHQARCLVIDPVSRAVQVRQRIDGARRRGAADRLVEGRPHHLGLYQPAQRDFRTDRKRHIAAHVQFGGHLDPPQLPGAGRRTQPRHVHHQIPRHRAFESGARIDPERRRSDFGRHFHRRRRGY